MIRKRPRRKPGETPLRGQLRLLSQERGIWQGNLSELLDTNLRDLRDYWGISTAARPISAIRDDVRRALESHYAGIRKPAGRKKDESRPKDFWHHFCLGFNLFDENTVQLTARLSSSQRSFSTAQRDFDLVCKGIEKQILATGFVPQMLVPAMQDDPQAPEALVKTRKVHKPEIVARGLVPLSPRAVTLRRVGVPYRRVAAPAPSRRGKRLSAVVVVSLFLVLVASGVMWQRPWVVAVSGVPEPASSSPSSTMPSTSSPTEPSTGQSEPSAPATPPVHIDSVREIYAVSQGYTYVFSNKRSFSEPELAALNRLEDDHDRYRQWFESRGGVVSAVSAVQIVVRGAAAVTVVIVDMRVVKKCGSYLRGTLFYSPPAGQDDTSYIGYDLSKQFPVAQNVQNGSLSGAFFQEHTISLKPGETHTLLVHAYPGVQYCKLHYELEVSTGGANKPISVSVDNNGKDFEVSAVPEFDGNVKFSDYPAIYAGGVANPQHTQGFVPVDPATYRGY